MVFDKKAMQVLVLMHTWVRSLGLLHKNMVFFFPIHHDFGCVVSGALPTCASTLLGFSQSERRRGRIFQTFANQPFINQTCWIYAYHRDRQFGLHDPFWNFEQDFFSSLLMSSKPSRCSPVRVMRRFETKDIISIWLLLVTVSKLSEKHVRRDVYMAEW